jgi:hypothetical protein
VSPIASAIRSTGSPSTSAAICGTTVSVPVPRSCVPVSTRALPSQRSRTAAVDGVRNVPIVQLAMPWPICQAPSHAPRGRLRQPNSRAPSS